MKHLQKLTILGVLAGLVLAIAPCARADLFNVPPENGPNPWTTPFPYQRNIFVDFPVPPDGPTPLGIPGAIYEGTFDPVLWGSDTLSLSGGATWQVDEIILPTGGSLTLRLDNLVNSAPIKHLYAEWVTNGVLTVDFTLPTGFAQTGEVRTPTTIWAQFAPNPPWEEMIFSNLTSTTIRLDALHVATECVPVPGGLLLGALGLATAGWRLRRRA